MPRPALRVPKAPGDHVFRTDRPLRPCLPGGHGQRTKAAARQASRSLSPAYSALTRWPSPLAVSIMSHGVSHPHSRHAFVIATASPRLMYTLRRDSRRDRDRADTDVVGALRPVLNRAIPRTRSNFPSASIRLHRGTSRVSSRGTSGDTFPTATVSARLPDRRHPVSHSGSRPHWFGCRGRASAIH